ncbi:hypothetical protein A2U01_0026507 [Trifolium medium]|uniref:Uncharacterized protein n=1 Tax=Trifolium medium TaxID=97028 RepID=A0A392P157_9FABA|nr:hypothetical protein [Trifolium medium]
MEDDLLIFPFYVTAEVEAIKAKFADAIDNYKKVIQKKIEGRGMDFVKKIMEYAERAEMKRLTLTPHFEPGERVVLEAFEKALAEGLRQFEEEEKEEEEKKRLKEEQKIQAEEEQKKRQEEEAAEKLISEQEKQKMQADIEAQKTRQDAMEVKVDTVVENQKDIASNLKPS